MKRIEKSILLLLVLTVFLMPLMGNTVTSENRGSSTFYFNSYDANEAWETDPGNMTDGDPDTYATTTIDRDVQLCDGNNCFGPPSYPEPTITKVEIRAKGYASAIRQCIYLRPVYDGVYDGNDLPFPLQEEPLWSPWFEISHPLHYPWDWGDIGDLDIDVEAVQDPTGPSNVMINCSIIQIKVTYGL